jgi:hypothetical protein
MIIYKRKREKVKYLSPYVRFILVGQLIPKPF